MKICPVGAKLFHVDRCTDMTKLTVVFHNFANTPKIMINLLKTKRNLLYIRNQFVPRSKHFPPRL